MPEHYTSPVKAPENTLKKKVVPVYKYLDMSDLCGDLGDVIKKLTSINESAPDGSTFDIYVSLVDDYDGQSVEVVIKENRLETDQECRIRLQKENDRVQLVLAQKRAQLEQLKKELGED